MQGAEDEGEGSVLTYVTEARIPKATQQIAFVQQSRKMGKFAIEYRGGVDGEIF